MSRRSLAGTALARWTQRSTSTPSPTRFGNGPKLATARARGNRTDRPDHIRTHIIMQILVTARGHGPRNRGTSQRGLPWQTLTISCLNRPGTRSCAITARLGTTWTSQPGTDTRTLSCCKNPRPYRPAVTASPPSHAVLTKSGRLLRPCEAGARPFTTFRTPTHQTLLNGLTPSARHHVRRPAKLKIFFWDTTIAMPRGSRNLCTGTGTTSRSRPLPVRPNLNPRRRETRLMPGHPCQETSTTTERSLSLPPKTSRTTRSLRS